MALGTSGRLIIFHVHLRPKPLKEPVLVKLFIWSLSPGITWYIEHRNILCCFQYYSMINIEYSNNTWFFCFDVTSIIVTYTDRRSFATMCHVLSTLRRRARGWAERGDDSGLETTRCVWNKECVKWGRGCWFVFLQGVFVIWCFFSFLDLKSTWRAQAWQGDQFIRELQRWSRAWQGHC